MLGTLAPLALALVLGTSALAGQDTHFVTAARDSASSAITEPAVVPVVPVVLATQAAATVALRSPAVPPRQEMPDSVAAQRRRAVEHSDWYYRRLTIHKAASFATVPLFVTEYILGDKLYKGEGTSSTRSAHQAVATGVGVLFGVNTITGVWNLWESRHESQGRARRTTHAILMMASDAGFVATAALAPEGDDFGEEDNNNRSTHRNVAIGSMGVSLVSYLMMYRWK